MLPNWLETDFVLSFFRGSKNEKEISYRKFVAAGIREGVKSPFKDTFASSVLGRKSFVEKIKEDFLSGLQASSDIRGSGRFREPPSIPFIVDTVRDIFHGDVRTGRQASIHFCCRYSGARLREIGAYFHITGAAVSQGSRRFEERISGDPRLGEAANRVRNILKC